MSLFDYKWIEAGSYPDQAAQHTMAHLSIRFGEDEKDVATYLYDKYKNKYVENITVPLVRLAEWFLVNWFHLWYEMNIVSAEPRPGFASRHDLSYAGNGFVFPRIIFDPMGDGTIHVSVQKWNPKHAAVEFRSEFEKILNRDELEKEIVSLVNNVMQRLQDKKVPCEFLKSEWQSIQSLDQEEYEFCQAAAFLGLDPFNIDHQTATHIANIWNDCDPFIRDEMMLCADKNSLHEVYGWIKDTIKSANQSTSGTDWVKVRKEVRHCRMGSRTSPWQKGYEDARAVRSILSKPQASFAFEEKGHLAIWNREQDAPSLRIEGCVSNDSPSCIIVHKKGKGKRFILARALGDYMGREKPSPAILNKLRTPRQARSRAFAAELLAPSTWLRDKVGNVQYLDSDAVDELATELDVSSLIVQHQIENHGIAKVYGSGW